MPPKEKAAKRLFVKSCKKSSPKENPEDVTKEAYVRDRIWCRYETKSGSRRR
jgi:hypothetical protein